MANDQISLEEYLAQNNARVENQSASDWKWDSIDSLRLTVEPLTTYSNGTSDPYYGAVPNVNVGSGFSTSATGINISSPVWTTNTTAGQYSFTGQNIQPGGKVVIQGKDADLVIGDKSMKTWMEKVEERLNILTPNPEMEKEWNDLRKLGERYRKLEKKCKEKSDMWNKLKAMPEPEIK